MMIDSRYDELRETLRVTQAASATTVDGGKAANKMDEALGGGKDKSKDDALVRAASPQTFGETAKVALRQEDVDDISRSFAHVKTRS